MYLCACVNVCELMFISALPLVFFLLFFLFFLLLISLKPYVFCHVLVF